MSNEVFDAWPEAQLQRTLAPEPRRERTALYENIPCPTRSWGEEQNRRKRGFEKMAEVREIPVTFATEVEKQSFSVDTSYQMKEVFDILKELSVIDPNKNLNKVILVQEDDDGNVLAQYRYDEVRTLEELGIEADSHFRVKYDLNVAADDLADDEIRIAFQTGSEKFVYAVPKDYTIALLFENLSEAHILDPSKQMNEINLLLDRGDGGANETFRFNDQRTLEQLGVVNDNLFFIRYDQNVA